MFRIPALFLLAFFSCSVLAQDTLNMTDSNGKRQGCWRKLDSAGRVIYVGYFHDGVPSGTFRYYYPDGKLKTISKLTNRGKLAETISYYPNGRIMATGNYLNEKKDSTWKFFSESTGTLVSEESYKAGFVDGESRVFYPDGGISELHYFKNGVMDGLWEQYYTDGKLKLRGSYQAGEKHGLFMTFYDSGQKMIEGQYSIGHQDGTWVYYDEKGMVSKKETFSHGDLIRAEPPEK
jgi:antitoxin component YwqK of YwqJK toxin-antitoxin module